MEKKSPIGNRGCHPGRWGGEEDKAGALECIEGANREVPEGHTNVRQFGASPVFLLLLTPTF